MKKVERVVNSTTNAGQPSPAELGAFLKAHMLGLISHINDLLQDVQGKKNVGSKQKIIRGLGAVIQQIGSTITYAAPQVRDHCGGCSQRAKVKFFRSWPRSKPWLVCLSFPK
jgi:serine/threonine-protein kinase ATR